jgi:hypothetical protein
MAGRESVSASLHSTSLGGRPEDGPEPGKRSRPARAGGEPASVDQTARTGSRVCYCYARTSVCASICDRGEERSKRVSNYRSVPRAGRRSDPNSATHVPAHHLDPELALGDRPCLLIQPDPVALAKLALCKLLGRPERLGALGLSGRLLGLLELRAGGLLCSLLGRELVRRLLARLLWLWGGL